jgi:cytochrome c oxidase subunit 4
MNMRRQVLSLLGVWAALIVLLAATVGATYLLPGPLRLGANMAIAVLKAGLVLWFFMQLDRASGLTRIFATGAILWLAILMTLISADLLTRP